MHQIAGHQPSKFCKLPQRVHGVPKAKVARHSSSRQADDVDEQRGLFKAMHYGNLLSIAAEGHFCAARCAKVGLSVISSPEYTSQQPLERRALLSPEAGGPAIRLCRATTFTGLLQDKLAHFIEAKNWAETF